MRTPLLLLLICLSICTFAQTKKQRLIAQSRYANADTSGCCIFVFADSSMYRYSGARHSRNDFISLNWSYFMSHFQGGTYSPLRLINGIVKPNNIDSLQYASMVDFDSTAFYRPDSNGKPIMSEFYTCDHYPDGKPRHLSGGGFTFDFIYLWGDLNGQRLVYQNQDTTWRLFQRDAAGNVVLEYYGRYGPPAYFSVGSVAQFEFDSLNRYTSHSESWGWYPSFFPEYRDYFEYYPDNKVKKVTIGTPRYPDSVYQAVYIDSFGYTAGVPGYTSRDCYYLGNSKHGFYDRTHINARALVDTLVRTYWRPTGLTRDVFIMEYNSAGNPIVITKGSERYFYYYEDYDPSLTVRAEVEGPSSITLYPNPATNRVFIMGVDVASVDIFDLTGRLVLSSEYSASGIDVQRLVDGVYVVRVKGRDGVATVRLVKH